MSEHAHPQCIDADTWAAFGAKPDGSGFVYRDHTGTPFDDGSLGLAMTTSTAMGMHGHSAVPIYIVPDVKDACIVHQFGCEAISGPVPLLARFCTGKWVVIVAASEEAARLLYGEVLRTVNGAAFFPAPDGGIYKATHGGTLDAERFHRLVKTHQAPMPLPSTSDSFHSPKHHGGRNEYTLKSISELAPAAEPDWVWPKYVAQGAVTLLTGLWKAGKTTLMGYVLRDLYRGGGMVDLPIDGPVLYVSEEPEGLWSERRDRLGLSPSILFLQRPTFARPDAAGWRELIAYIVKQVKELGIVLVVFDTLPSVWPVLNENDAGETTDALTPLRDVAAAGAAVLLIAHPRKSGGTEATATRGSGALPGFVDVIVELRRYNAEDSKDTRRVLTGYGRFAGIPAEMVIELTADGYTVLGDLGTAGHFEAIDTVRAILPTGGPGLTWDEVKNRWPSAPQPGQTRLRGVLTLGAQEGRWAVSGTGVRGNPFRYYIPPPEDSFPSPQCHSERNESAADAVSVSAGDSGWGDVGDT